ncbi:MAG: hypothetical protein ACJ76S_06685 [Solirubrobacteraceae bacterium]
MLGATAVAASGEPFPASPQARPAAVTRELPANLRLRDQHSGAHRAEFARDLARRLDLNVADVEQALENAHRRLARAFASDSHPNPGLFVETLADELGKSQSQVREALHAVFHAALEQRLDAAVKAGRLTRDQADRIRSRIE